MVKLVGTGGNQVPTNNMLGNMAFQNKEGVSADLVSLAAGTAAAPSLIPSGDPNTGVWFPAADTIAASTNGSERLRIDSSGNVGIGNSSPSGRLDVAGNNVSLFLRSNDTNDSTLRYYVNSVEVATARGKTGNIFAIETGGSERVRIDASGNLLVGTSSAIAGNKIESITNLGVYRFTNATSGPYLNIGKSRSATIGTNTIVQTGDEMGTVAFYGANGTTYTEGAYIRAIVATTPGASNDMPGSLIFATTANGAGSATERMRITEAGNVGIGTIAPSTKLHIVGTSGNILIRLDDAINPRNNYIGVDNYEQVVLSANESNTVGATPLIKFRINASEKARIDASGNVGIGTTILAAQLTVNGSGGIFSVNGYNYATISTLTSSADAVFGGGMIADTGVSSQVKKTTADPAHMIRMQIYDGIAFHTNFTGAAGTSFARTANQRMSIDVNGNVVINTAAVATTATNGFLYVPGCAGTPTGVPTAYTGRVPIVVDTTNNKLYFYSGGAWRDAGP